jgi:hypothetical protein
MEIGKKITEGLKNFVSSLAEDTKLCYKCTKIVRDEDGKIRRIVKDGRSDNRGTDKAS